MDEATELTTLEGLPALGLGRLADYSVKSLQQFGLFFFLLYLSTRLPSTRSLFRASPVTAAPHHERSCPPLYLWKVLPFDVVPNARGSREI